VSLFQNAVGEDLYVWSEKSGAPSGRTAECVISAHGAQSFLNHMFPVGNTTLVFYGPHGYTLNDLGIEKFVSGQFAPYEQISQGQCQDYSLGKYQGRHNRAGETYDKIGNMDGLLARTVAEAARGSRAAALQVANMDADDPMFNTMLRSLDEGGKTRRRYQSWMDIVTIRNRSVLATGSGTVMLSDVVSRLAAAGYNYTKVHCAFCRGPISPFVRSAGDYTPTVRA
jgi:hypothetical protein